MVQIASSSFILLLMRFVLLSAGELAASEANALTIPYDWGSVYTSSQKTTTAYDAVLAAEAQTIKIYYATGVLVRTADVAKVSTNVELPAGFDIAAGQKFIAR